MRFLDSRATRFAIALIALGTLTATANARSPAPDAGPATDCLFDWMEQQYPAVFGPAGASSAVRDGHYFRDYGQTGTRLSAGTGRLWLLAPGAVEEAEAGPLAEWLARAGCASADTKPPQVLYTSRSDGAVEVAQNARVIAAFSEPVRSDRPLAETLTVTGEDGRAAAGTVRYDARAATLVFEPAGKLEAGRTYTATVANTVTDLSGNPLPARYSWRFTTAGTPLDFSEVEQDIQFVLDRALWRNDIPGATIAVLGNKGSLWRTASGHADRTTRTPMTPGHLFRIGSNTKTFVATEILRLAEAGRVELDAPITSYLGQEISAYLPAYANSTATVRQVLNHTSGIFNFTVDAEWGEAFITDPTRRYFPQELLMIANRNVDPASIPPPGTLFSYSNTNYVLLGLLIGKLGPLVYEDAMRANLLAPLGLQRTLVPSIGDATPPPGTSRGYWEDTETGVLHDVSVKDPSTVWSSGDMIADAADLARWGRALGEGTMLTPAMQSMRLQFVPMDDVLEYGLGIVRDRNAALLGHQGGIIGYTSQVYYSPDEGATLAFFYNRTLAMHDYSAVMTYDALKLLWPERYRWLNINPVALVPAGSEARSMRLRSAGAMATRRAPHGMLSEY